MRVKCSGLTGPFFGILFGLVLAFNLGAQSKAKAPKAPKTMNVQGKVQMIDKGTSAPIWQHVLTPPIPADGPWGTSFWGGDLYLYTKTPSSVGSSVWRYRPSDQSTVQLVPDVGFTIVGAGESTCVPTAPPK